MTALTVYGVAASRTFRVLWMARELDLHFKHVLIGFRGTDSTSSREFLKINPNGKIPTIVDGKLTLSESMAINLYLAKKHSSKLYPRTLKGEALAWQWSFWAVTEVDQPIIDWARNAIVLPPEQRDSKAAKAAMDKLKGPFSVIDKALVGGDYLLGRRFTVADLNVASVLYRARAMQLSNFPNLADWLTRCYARPAAQAAVKMRE